MTSSVRTLRTLSIDDRTYELWARPCQECGEDIYAVMRTSGPIVSIFKFDHLEMDDFELFCRDIDEDLLLTAPQLASDFYEDLQKVNSSSGIEADFSFAFRLLEFGRTRLSLLQALGAEEALRDTSEKLPKESAAIQAAFELGFAAGQYATEKHTEDFFWAGVRTVEARRAGQEQAKLALTVKGKKTRAAVMRAAEEVRRLRPEIAHNVAAVAREIQKLGKAELCRSDGSPIQEETICKYLREARKCKKTENRQAHPDSGNPPDSPEFSPYLKP